MSITVDTVDGPELVLQAQPEATALHPQQLGNGVVKYYRAFARAEKAYRMTNDSIHLKREMPILYAYTGEKTEIDGHEEDERLVFDISVLTLGIVDPDVEQQTAKRKRLLQQVLGPWNNLYVAEYTKQMRELALFARNAWTAFNQSQVEFTLAEPAEKFDVLVQAIHDAYAEFVKHWEPLDACLKGEAVPDPLLTISGADGQVSLSSILGLAGVTDREKIAEVGNQLMNTQAAELQQRMLPCLEQVAMAANQAVLLLDQRTQK